jgi:hypothetical protein
MEAPCILGRRNTDGMVRIGRQEEVVTGTLTRAEEYACWPLSLEGRNHLHNNVMFLKSEN